MNAIDKAFAEYKTAMSGFEAAERRVLDAKAALLRALDVWPAGATPAPGDAAKSVGRIAPASKPKASPAPKAPPSKPASAPMPTRPVAASAPAVATPWTAAEAKATVFALGAYEAVVGAIVAAGGSVPVNAMPSCVEGQTLAVSGVAAACNGMRQKARKRGARSDFIGERAGRVVLDPGFVAAYRAWMEPHREERALRSAIDPGAGS